MGNRLHALILAAAICLAAPALADAHSSMRVLDTEVAYVSIDATTVNDLTATAADGRLEFSDPAVVGGINPAQCDPGDVNARGDITSVRCKIKGLKAAGVEVGDREDRVSVDLPLPTRVDGGPGSDTLISGPGGDTLLGGDGNDTLTGGDGADLLQGGPGQDTIDAGPGDDKVAARDGTTDTITCGPGNDVVDADTFDVVGGDCESVAAVEVPAPVVPDGGGNLPGPPKVRAGAVRTQKGKVTVYATSNEAGAISASGRLRAGGLDLPIELLGPKRVPVAGGGVQLTYVPKGRHRRVIGRALARGRRVTVTLGVVATDTDGQTTRTQAPTVRIARRADRTAGRIERVTCAAACTATVEVTRRGRTLASGNARLEAAGTTYIVLRRLPGARLSGKARLEVRLTDDAGAETRRTSTVKL